MTVWCRFYYGSLLCRGSIIFVWDRICFCWQRSVWVERFRYMEGLPLLIFFQCAFRHILYLTWSYYPFSPGFRWYWYILLLYLFLYLVAFQGLCGALHSLDQGLVCVSNWNMETLKESTLPCYYILQPSQNGSMFLRVITESLFWHMKCLLFLICNDDCRYQWFCVLSFWFRIYSPWSTNRGATPNLV